MNTDFLITESYKRLWGDPELERRIDEGISRHRKSDGVIRITDAGGRPLPGTRVEVRQLDSAFHFGANIFMLGGYPTDELNRKYEEAFCGLFNGATVPFYWRGLEPEQGRPRYSADSAPFARRPPPDVVIAFCESRGIRMHGHYLVWDFIKWSIPEWLPADPAASEPIWENRVREIGGRYGRRIGRWDVVNEAVAGTWRPSGGFPMPEDYERKAFAWAEKYFPADARLDINETVDAWEKDLDAYCGLVTRLLDDKARIGGVGLQFHLFADEDMRRVLAGELYPPGKLLDALDRCGALDRPIHISEITLTSPGNSDEGLRAQAEVARNYYRLWFSHRAVDGITWWNVPDGGAAPGEDNVFSGLLHDDLSPKPAYHALKDLLHREWRTEASGATGEDGCFRFRGFHGKYLVKTESGAESSIVLPQNIE
ncbi:MAG: endo-1,4-beta-xylanase [Verrucomicrobiae bacterium]